MQFFLPHSSRAEALETVQDCGRHLDTEGFLLVTKADGVAEALNIRHRREWVLELNFSPGQIWVPQYFDLFRILWVW